MDRSKLNYRTATKILFYLQIVAPLLAQFMPKLVFLQKFSFYNLPFIPFQTILNIFYLPMQISSIVSLIIRFKMFHFRDSVNITTVNELAPFLIFSGIFFQLINFTSNYFYTHFTGCLDILLISYYALHPRAKNTYNFQMQLIFSAVKEYTKLMPLLSALIGFVFSLGQSNGLVAALSSYVYFYLFNEIQVATQYVIANVNFKTRRGFKIKK